MYPQRQTPLMSDELLEKYMQDLINSAGDGKVEVAWQGGEPTLRGIEFFRKSIELAQRYRKPTQKIYHTLQTNGTLINEEWAVFLKKNNYLVGLSLDGPRHMHDAYRISKGGEGTFDSVIKAWRLLQKHEVDVNILCTVHAANENHPVEVYRFFRDELNAKHIQIIPIIERCTPETLEISNDGWEGSAGRDRPLYKQEGSLVTNRSVQSEQYGRFLIDIFDEWIKTDVGSIYVTTFDVALGSWLGQHNSCVVSPTCGAALAMEHNGDVYSCDHYVEPDHYLGNINDTPLGTLVSSEKQRRFGHAKYETLPNYCKKCPVLFACYGECPRNRFILTPDGEPGLNYLCSGYKAFFEHIDRPMKKMRSLLMEGRYADEIMSCGEF